MSRPCRFFNTPGGCNRGSQCRFAHSSPSDTSTRPPSTPDNPAPPQRIPRPNGNGNPPSGVCRYFWEQGRCNREFNCRYAHTQRADRPTPSPAPTSSGTMSRSATVLQRITPFLTGQGLSKMSGSGTDGFFSQDSASMTPTEAHNSLKRFLSDNFKFKSTFEVYAFLKSLNSATASNAGWTQEDGQLLLQTMASQNGLHRLISIMLWPQVSTHAGNSRDVLSFQRGILPILRYLSSDFVVKSTLVTRVNTLFTEVLQNLKELADTIENNMADIMTNCSFRDPGFGTNHPQLGAQVLASIAGVLDECLVRFKNAVAMYPRLISLVTNLRLWFDQWTTGIFSSPPTFDDPFQNIETPVRDLLVNALREKVNRLESIVNRELGKETRSGSRRNGPGGQDGISNEGLIAALHGTYDPPGELRPDGPRHDNDFVDIYNIRVAPTHEELMCRTQPFLPASLYDAPHPAPADSMPRLLDGQFRLLREELTAPLRRAVQLVQDDMNDLNQRKTRLGEILQRGGGKYHGVDDSHESLMFNVYTDVTFKSLVPDRRGISTSLTVQTPSGRARSAQAGVRTAFWKGMSGKRLVQGGLVALVWQTNRAISVHLGTIASSVTELTEHVQSNANSIKIRVVFFDSEIELRILSELKTGRSLFDGVKVLIESPVLFEAIRPFLEALKTEPETIPFSRYLVFHPSDYLRSCTIDPPKYMRIPGFDFQLSSLFDSGAEVDDLRMSVSDKSSVDRARAELRQASRLDPSQADAVIAALSRELVLIQGPPGTGKSYTGVELLRVLIANDIGPILMIAFTNHALDHMLCSVLDASITTDIVRLGSRTSDDRISQYSIETREMAAGQSRLCHTYSSKYREVNDVGKEISSLIERMHKIDLESDSSEIVKYLELYYPEQHAMMSDPPPWIGVAKSLSQDDSESGEKWQTKGPRGKVIAEDSSLYAFWKNCGDLGFLETITNPTVSHAPQTSTSPTEPGEPGPSSRSNRFELLKTETMADVGDTETSEEDDDDESDEEMVEILPEKSWMTAVFSDMPPDSNVDTEAEKASAPASLPEPSTQSPPITEMEAPYAAYVNDAVGFFAALGEAGVPTVPFGNRTLDALVDEGGVWDLSRHERQTLHELWIEEARMAMQKNQQDEYDRLRKRHATEIQEYNEIREEVRRDLLKGVKIIGCTTTGAAKLGTLLKSLSPKVLMVEEAGQVLEAHVLGSLVPSIEHLILIGDPLQLRPTLNNFALSMDHSRGSRLYRFDMSLMERLSTSGLPMSRIDVQRRMRPTISSLIRNTLYEGLQDHELVKSYPDVRGMVKNLFFVTHNHKENGGTDDTASKYNMYEVEMIRDLVLYLLRQGCYSAEGDIVVLCAYLGQLARLRDALGGEVAVVIDERDQAALDDREADQDDAGDALPGGSIQHVKVTQRVRLRTVDNYQGEEGKIVILSLVRNSGGADDDVEMSKHTRVNIGFLKSENRTNVALSRAREGLYIFGNAENLSSRSRMWRSILDELDAQDALGPALPVACHRHRERVEYVSFPGQLSRIAPDGGCMEQCDMLLKCGHLCPFKCHCDDPNHIAVMCTKPCRRLCPRDHPCRKDCHTPCGDCQFPVRNVQLPCGHVKDSIPCHRLDTLESVRCNAEVLKQLPDCEHQTRLPCSQDPEDYRCMVRCAELMACCGKNCNATCDDCQSLNDNTLGVAGAIKRIQHAKHPCQKRLYCEHGCQEPCSEGHEHSTRCNAKCRQVCPHAQCKHACYVPCAPCKQPCTWVCPHHTCPVPCGSVCARLPCDKRCEGVLHCGHRCPSVCGEDCTIQVCPQCASEDQRAQVADFIMQRTLADIDPDLESLDEMLITIPSCRHAFTVETLDGHCGMTEFYSCRADGKWLGLLSPIGFRRPPTCPTCRAEITAPRYGRVFKRADLDILERNVAAQMSLDLGTVQTSLQSVSINARKDQLVKAAETINLRFKDKTDEKKRVEQGKTRTKALSSKKEAPISDRQISPANKGLHAIDSSVLDVWRKAMHELLIAYRQAVQVAGTRSAHKDAWEAALSSLHEREVNLALANPGTSPRDPMTHAMRVAKIKIGQPRPLADRRFLVEAIWLTIHIRLILTDLTTTWLDAISKRIGDGNNTTQQLAWATFIEFLFKSCSRDADVAFDVAKDSESHRQLSKTALYQMRISLEEFRFDMMMCKMTGQFKEQGHRAELAERASSLRGQAEAMKKKTIREHREKKTSREEMDWLETNFSSVARDIVDEWAKIERSIRLDKFYEPVSLEERIAIVKAFNFAHAGHFYNCPNGHTFVITECGGANQVSRCPECDAVIGGSGHYLDPSNTRSEQFEALAMEHVGAERTPWGRPW
ncbi:hypothetical protein HD554DRAFT_1598622 [Boletus coccyginus]|nr:hypothetical protein HD554DRAFT_1598622 [Boletus coccyginus]